MRKGLGVLVVFSILWACVDEPPEYDLIRPTESDRVVLIEEFSGVRCPNCPQGSQELENLKVIHGDNLVIVSIHAGDFAFPYPLSKYDFSTDGGDILLDLLGNPLGYPSAVVNRELQQGGGYQVFSSRWASMVREELQEEAVMNLHTEVSYDSLTRNVGIHITILPLEVITRSLYLSVQIKEDNIVDPQADRAVSEGVVPDYVHKNVLRVVLSDPEGDPLMEDVQPFQVIEREYNYTLPPEDGWWVASNCFVVTYVSNNAGSLEVLQADEVALVH